MLVLYAIEDERPSLMEICHVYREEGNAYFIPTRPDYKEIKITGVTQYEYEDILESLYGDEKVDLTGFRRQTSEVDVD